MPTDLTISIVSYNTASDLLACLASIYDHPPEREFRVVVVDNGSADDSVELVRLHFPQAVVIETHENLGYGRANNGALLGAEGRYYAVLNSDLVLGAGSLDKCCDYLEADAGAGIVGGALLSPDGSPQMDWAAGELNIEAVISEQLFLARIFPMSPVFGDYFRSWWPRSDTRALPQVCGAFMVARADVYNSLRGFDSAYFMYCEDTDLCRRITNLGLKCVYIHDAVAIHGHGNSSTGSLRPRMVLEHNRSRCIYLTHFAGVSAAKRAKMIMVVGAALRYKFWSIAGRLLGRQSLLDKCQTYSEVLLGTSQINVPSLTKRTAVDATDQSGL